jgi:hypothetical protein
MGEGRILGESHSKAQLTIARFFISLLFSNLFSLLAHSLGMKKSVKRGDRLKLNQLNVRLDPNIWDI